MTTTTSNLEKARALYEKAQEADRLEQEQAAAKAAADRRAADERFLAEFDDEQLGCDIRSAQQRVREAVTDDPVFLALAEVYAAQLRRAHLAAEAQSVAARLGVQRTIVSRPASEPTLETLTRYIAELGEDLHNAAQDG